LIGVAVVNASCAETVAAGVVAPVDDAADAGAAAEAPEAAAALDALLAVPLPQADSTIKEMASGTDTANGMGINALRNIGTTPDSRFSLISASEMVRVECAGIF